MNAKGRNLKGTLAATWLMILTVPGILADDPQSRSDPFLDVRARIEGLIREKTVPSLSLAVVKDGEVVWEEAFGLANMPKSLRAAPQTLYPIASVTKPITATALMILVERGVVKLDEPINSYLRKAQIRSGTDDPSGATVRRVLQHTSGLPMYWSFSYGGNSRPRTALETTIQRYGRLVSLPGESYNYSNLGYGVLEYLIEQVTGKTYPEFLAAEVFGPLNMGRAAIFTAPPNRPDVAEKYSASLAPIPFYDHDTRGASAVYATAHDLTLFMRPYLGRLEPGQKAILKPESIVAMLKARDPDVRTSSYALGWETGLRNGYPIITHGGIMDGCRAHMAMIPSESLAAAVLINGENVRSIEVCDWIFAALLPQYARSMKAVPQGPAGSPTPSTSFRPPAALVGTWDGTVQSHEEVIFVRLRVDPGGEVELFRLNEQGVPGKGLRPLKTPALNRGMFVVHFPQVFTTSDAPAAGHRTILGLTVRKDRLTGEANLIDSAMSYSLPSYIELNRSAARSTSSRSSGYAP